jgi:hypothetical protein
MNAQNESLSSEQRANAFEAAYHVAEAHLSMLEGLLRSAADEISEYKQRYSTNQQAVAVQLQNICTCRKEANEDTK